MLLEKREQLKVLLESPACYHGRRLGCHMISLQEDEAHISSLLYKLLILATAASLSSASFFFHSCLLQTMSDKAESEAASLF